MPIAHALQCVTARMSISSTKPLLSSSRTISSEPVTEMAVHRIR